MHIKMTSPAYPAFSGRQPTERCFGRPNITLPQPLGFSGTHRNDLKLERTDSFIPSAQMLETVRKNFGDPHVNPDLCFEVAVAQDPRIMTVEGTLAVAREMLATHRTSIPEIGSVNLTGYLLLKYPEAAPVEGREKLIAFFQRCLKPKLKPSFNIKENLMNSVAVSANSIFRLKTGIDPSKVKILESKRVPNHPQDLLVRLQVEDLTRNDLDQVLHFMGNANTILGILKKVPGLPL